MANPDDVSQTVRRDLFRALEAAPENADAYYLDIYARPDMQRFNAVHLLKQAMDWSSGASLQFLMGYRGTGKTTELLRLRDAMAHDPAPATQREVLYVDLSSHLNLNVPVDITDFLLVVGTLLLEKLGARLDATFSESVKAALSGLKLRLGDSTAGAEVTVADVIRNDPSLKAKLNQALAEHVAPLARSIQDKVDERLKALGKEAVLIVDSLEQVQGGGQSDQEVQASLQTLLVTHLQLLRLPRTHVVLSTPPWMRSVAPNLGSGADGTCMLPCFKVRTRSGEAYEPGIQVLDELMQKRGPWRKAFAEEDRRRLILQSGGYLRDLFRMVKRGLLMAESLPIPANVVDTAVTELQSDYAVTPVVHRAWLRRIKATGMLELPTPEDMPVYARFLNTAVILAYRNDKEWFCTHPALDEWLAVEDAPGAGT